MVPAQGRLVVPGDRGTHPTLSSEDSVGQGSITQDRGQAAGTSFSLEFIEPSVCSSSCLENQHGDILRKREMPFMSCLFPE